MWLKNPKEPNFAAPTLGIESIYFKSGLSQNAAGFVETKGNLAKYAPVSYKQNSVDAGKTMEEFKAPLYTETEEPVVPTERVVYNNWELKLGFRIETVHADGEFHPPQALIQGMPGGPRVNLMSANEHVPNIEWRIWVIKERSRDMIHSLPFNMIPKFMTIHVIINIGKMLNYFPTKAGVSTTIIPSAILNREKMDYKKNLRFQYGKYCRVHENKTPHNRKKDRKQCDICLVRTGNQRG